MTVKFPSHIVTNVCVNSLVCAEYMYIAGFSCYMYFPNTCRDQSYRYVSLCQPFPLLVNAKITSTRARHELPLLGKQNLVHCETLYSPLIYVLHAIDIIQVVWFCDAHIIFCMSYLYVQEIQNESFINFSYPLSFLAYFVTILVWSDMQCQTVLLLVQDVQGLMSIYLYSV